MNGGAARNRTEVRRGSASGFPPRRNLPAPQKCFGVMPGDRTLLAGSTNQCLATRRATPSKSKFGCHRRNRTFKHVVQSHAAVPICLGGNASVGAAGGSRTPTARRLLVYSQLVSPRDWCRRTKRMYGAKVWVRTRDTRCFKPVLYR